MTDNIAPEEVKRRLIMFLRIPNETWTEVLAMLSRRILIQKIAPACYRLKEICDKNVKSVHVISNAKMFNNNLENDKTEAKQQLEHLTANKCALAGQFRLTGSIKINQKNWDAIFRHCSELLRGCRIEFQLVYLRPQHSSFRQAFMTQMELLEPASVKLELIEPAENSILEHPTVLKCNRLSLDLFGSGTGHDDDDDEVQGRDLVQQARAWPSSAFKDIHKWLHHRRDDQTGEEARCMIFFLLFHDIPSINWLLDQCIQDFQQSGKQADRRKFVLNFYSNFIELANKFDRIENHATGEVLLLQLKDRNFRLRRCLAEEVEGQKEFYEKMFKSNEGWDEFNNEDEWKTAKVWIE